MAHDPVVATPVRRRPSLEPRFVLEGQEERAAARHRALPGVGPASQHPGRPLRRRRLGRLRLLRRRRGRRRPHPQHRPAGPDGDTPHVLLLRALLHAVACLADDRAGCPCATASCARPCTGSPGGLDGEVTLPSCSLPPATSPRRSGSGTWGRTSSPSPRTSASTTSTASSRFRTCTPSGATRTSSPRSSTARSGRMGREHALQQVLRARHPGR